MASENAIYEEEFDDEQIKMTVLLFKGMISAAGDEGPEVKKAIVDQFTEQRSNFVSNVDRILEGLNAS